MGNELLKRLPPVIQTLIEKYGDRLPFFSAAELPDELREMHFMEDRIGAVVRKWAMANCLVDEQPHSLLGFQEHGRPL